MAKIGDSVLIFDIETKTFGKPDITKDETRFFGCYSYKTDKYYLLSKRDEIQKAINAHRVLVGFNSVGTKFEPGYDVPILKREKYIFNKNSKGYYEYKIQIDLKKIFKSRASQMKIKAGMLGDLLMKYSLKFIAKIIGIVSDEDNKKDIDYAIFRKDTWTTEELNEIRDYTIRDIEVTKKMFDWVEDYFEGFKGFIKQEDSKNYQHITVTTANFGYKCICNAMRWTEKYGKTFSDGERIGGGYVSYPSGEIFDDDIYCLDFNSLYPFLMAQCNLHERRNAEDINECSVWFGDGKWKTEGCYYSDKIGKIAKLIIKWYITRMYYKRTVVLSNKQIIKMKDISEYKGQKFYNVDIDDNTNLEIEQKEITDDIIEEFLKLAAKGVDRKEYSIKIILNSMYGILNSVFYTLVYDRVAGGDCTRLGRQWIKYARKIFREAGYKVICTDTDSCYIIDVYHDKEKLLKVKDEIIKYIKSSVPFPQDMFDMGVDAEIKYMYFFKGKNKEDKDTDSEMDDQDFFDKPKGLMKKNYIYVENNGDVTIKNLGIRKRTNSALSKEIFWKHLVPKIKEGQIKFSKIYIKDLISKLLHENFELAMMRFDVDNYDKYKSKSCKEAQISQTYGQGIHFLIPNLKGVGAGKNKKFCSLDDFKEYKLRFEDIDLDNVWKELNYFIKVPKTLDIFSFG